MGAENRGLTPDHITLLQCNIGGNPRARLARGATLRHLIDSNKPTFVLLRETKRKRKDIPFLPCYSFLSLDPLRDHRGELCFTIRIVYAFVPRSYLHPNATLSYGLISGTINLPLKTSILVGYTLLRPIAQTVGRYLSITNLTVRHLNFRVLQAIVYWLGTSMLESARYLEITKLIPI